MKDVYLEEFAYPCARYAVLRTGCKYSVRYIMETALLEKYTTISCLKIGDIVVWEKDKGEENANLTICDKSIITTRLFYGRHIGVYEGKGLVSDLVFIHETYYPTIRLKKMCDYPNPVGYLSINKDIVNEQFF